MHARRIAIAALAALAMGTAFAQAPGGPGAGAGPGPGRGPGMMGGGYGGGSGPGMMGGYGAGNGYGPGMMGGGYGPGMMGEGWGGGGPGWGRGGGRGWAMESLGLTDEQRGKIAQIQEESRRKNWNAMGELRGEQFKLRQLYNADRLDEKAIVDQQRKVDDLRRQLLASRVAVRNQVHDVLNADQRQRFRGFGPMWMRGEAEE